MTIEIRRVRPDELGDSVEALTAAFLERPDIDAVVKELSPRWDLDRVWVAHDGERVCGTFRSWATEITVPGGARLPAAAVSGVTVLPTHRRRGILRGMIAAEHAAIRERGEAMALLHAAEYPIYGRFGYGPGTLEATWTLDTRAAVVVPPASGRVEYVVPGPDSLPLVRDVYERYRVGQPGEIRRMDYRWEGDLGMTPGVWSAAWKGFLVLHRDEAGTIDGYARFSRTEDRWDGNRPSNVVTLDELHALTTESYATLWRFLAEMDWVATVKAPRRARDEDLPWLLADARHAQLTDVTDGLWVRLFDVAAALAARTYEREARMVIEVVDAERAEGRYRVRLDAGPDGATCVETGETAEITVPVAALGAAYLGGSSLRHALLAGGADEHRAGALDRLDALLRTRDEPWTSTFF
jgi:predicted acetyltransferase